MAPSHDRCIGQNRSESIPACFNLLHAIQLILDGTAVTTEASIAPKSRRIHRIESQRRQLLLLESAAHFASWHRTEVLSPPKPAWPHATTELSARIAAKAPLVAWIRCTFFRLILHGAAVTTKMTYAPSCDRSVAQNRGKRWPQLLESAAHS